MLFPCGRLPHPFTADHTPRRTCTQWPLGALIAALALRLGIRQSFPPGKTRADGRGRHHFLVVASTNLVVPPYRFSDPDTLEIGVEYA
jgi:hypothetical protein